MVKHALLLFLRSIQKKKKKQQQQKEREGNI